MVRFRSRRILAAAAAVLALTQGACERTDNLLPPEDIDTPLFEVEMRNSAWGFHWSGFYVDAEGRVYQWDRSKQPNSALADSVLTPAQLAAKYSSERSLVKTLPEGEALQRYQLVPQAAVAQLAELKGMCADAGTVRFGAWVHSAQDGKYHRVLLHMRGDMATTRQSEAARTLWKWLDQVLENGDTFCDPYAG
ncbi:MAG TPA: hypothetical protein VFS20_09820 [Longimicrobium sp.]|nr:hypothetical protein [Longimicrobium sp.]